MDLEISVIIPCFNVESYVRECVLSVIEQSLQPVEIICVNDGSSDNTYNILKNLESKYSLVKVFTQTNRGQSAATNKGINESRAEYLQFLDADDLLYKNKLEHQSNLLNKISQKPDIIATAIEKRFEDGTVKIAKEHWYGAWEGLAKYEIGLTSSNLWKKKAVLAAGGFDENLPSNKEHDLIFRMLMNGATVIHDPEPLTIKRERKKGSISANRDHHHLKRKVEHRYRIYEYTKQHKLLNQKELNMLIEENIHNLKSIYRKDKNLAVNLFRKNIPSDYKIKSDFSKVYKILFNTIGFEKTEYFRSYFGN